jgi:anaerobic selenocysteine-containing dehydrogenase
MAENPQAAPLGALVLYHTLGPSLPDGTAAAAPMWFAAQACARRNTAQVRRALSADDSVPDKALGDLLFDRLVGSRQGTAFTTHGYDEVWSLVEHPDRKVRLAIPSMLEWLGRLDPAEAAGAGAYPFVLAAGQRRMFNANQIFRDPKWRRDDPDGALMVNPADLGALEAGDGDWLAVVSEQGRLVVRAKSDDSMRRGQLVLPHGYGQAYPAADGARLVNGPRINQLTSGSNRDPVAGTPYHKHVRVRLERASAAESAAAAQNHARIFAA